MGHIAIISGHIDIFYALCTMYIKFCENYIPSEDVYLLARKRNMFLLGLQGRDDDNLNEITPQK